MLKDMILKLAYEEDMTDYPEDDEAENALWAEEEDTADTDADEPPEKNSSSLTSWKPMPKNTPLKKMRTMPGNSLSGSY